MRKPSLKMLMNSKMNYNNICFTIMSLDLINLWITLPLKILLISVSEILDLHNASEVLKTPRMRHLFPSIQQTLKPLCHYLGTNVTKKCGRSIPIYRAIKNLFLVLSSKNRFFPEQLSFILQTFLRPTMSLCRQSQMNLT